MCTAEEGVFCRRGIRAAQWLSSHAQQLIYSNISLDEQVGGK